MSTEVQWIPHLWGIRTERLHGSGVYLLWCSVRRNFMRLMESVWNTDHQRQLKALNPFRGIKTNTIMILKKMTLVILVMAQARGVCSQPNILNHLAAVFRPTMRRISWVCIILIIIQIVILSFWQINHSAQSHGSSLTCEDMYCIQRPPKYPKYPQYPAVSWWELKGSVQNVLP